MSKGQTAMLVPISVSLMAVKAGSNLEAFNQVVGMTGVVF